MAISPINILSVTRSQEYTSIKQNEDNRAAMTQISMSEQKEKELKLRSQQVINKEAVGWQQKRFDAKEQGDNSYGGDGGRKRKSPSKDKVIQKIQQGFDIKI